MRPKPVNLSSQAGTRLATSGSPFRLNKKNARAFRKQLAPSVEHARRAV